MFDHIFNKISGFYFFLFFALLLKKNSHSTFRIVYQLVTTIRLLNGEVNYIQTFHYAVMLPLQHPGKPEEPQPFPTAAVLTHTPHHRTVQEKPPNFKSPRLLPNH